MSSKRRSAKAFSKSRAQAKEALKSKTTEELTHLCCNSKSNSKRELAHQILDERTRKISNLQNPSRIKRKPRKRSIFKQLSEAGVQEFLELNHNLLTEKIKAQLKPLLDRFHDYDLLELEKNACSEAIRKQASEIVKKRNVPERIKSRLEHFKTCTVDELKHIVIQKEHYFEIAKDILHDRLRESLKELSRSQLKRLCIDYPNTLEAQIAIEIDSTNHPIESPAPDSGIDWRNDAERTGLA
jgi:hypothetical protein